MESIMIIKIYPMAMGYSIILINVYGPTHNHNEF